MALPAPDYLRKIVTPEALAARLPALRMPRPGQTRDAMIVQCHGCFDIVHPGHIRYLQFARTQGDVLIVSITGDSAIDKGDQRPYIPQELRAENLAVLEIVDFVVIDSHETACSLLQLLRPDVYVKGEEYATSSDPRFLEERRIVESAGGRVIFSSGEVVFSSSRLLESLPSGEALAATRLKAVCRRHDLDSRAVTRLLGEMQNKRVLVIGGSSLERYALCDSGNLADDAPMLTLRKLGQRSYPGRAAFVAQQVAALGGRCTLLTALGQRQRATTVRTKLTAAGIDVVDVGLGADIPLSTRFLVDDSKLFKVDQEASAPLDSDTQRRIVENLMGLLTQCDAMVLFDAGPSWITPAVLQQVAPTLRQRGTILAAPLMDAMAAGGPPVHFDVICASERRMRSAAGDLSAGLSALAYDALRATQARRMIVTLGKRGLVTFDRQSQDRGSPQWHGRLRSEYLPALGDRVVDRFGCGESMLVAATLAMTAGASLMQSAYIGTLASAMQIAKLGPAAVTSEEMRELAARRNELIVDSSFEPQGPTRPARIAPRIELRPSISELRLN